MSRIIAVTLLLLILVDDFNGSTASSAGFHVSKVHIRKCRWRVFPNGKIKCHYPLFPTNQVEKQKLIKCFCSKAKQHKFPDLKAVCTTWHPGLPISLL